MDEDDVFDDPGHNSGDGFDFPGNQSMPIKPSGVRYAFRPQLPMLSNQNNQEPLFGSSNSQKQIMIRNNDGNNRICRIE
jgi:hypothetical protein